jgi:pimeloyl-ACP methyl ester carboxylesterase
MPAGVVRRTTLILRDGRRLAYTVLGAPRETARATLIYHHGWPSSAQEAIVCAEAAARQGLALVAFDRPGIGGSSYHPALSFRMVADDVAQLMDALGIASAVQVGTSGAAGLGARRGSCVCQGGESA